MWGSNIVESKEPSIKHNFVTAMVKGDTGPAPGHWAIKGGDATTGGLTVYWDGARPTDATTGRWKNGTDAPMKKQVLILGVLIDYHQYCSECTSVLLLYAVLITLSLYSVLLLYS